MLNTIRWLVFVHDSAALVTLLNLLLCFSLDQIGVRVAKTIVFARTRRARGNGGVTNPISGSTSGLRYSLFHRHQRARLDLPQAGLLHRPDRLPLERQVRGRRQEDPPGQYHPPRQALGGDRRPLHVPEYASLQTTPARQRGHDREVSSVIIKQS